MLLPQAGPQGVGSWSRAARPSQVHTWCLVGIGKQVGLHGEPRGLHGEPRGLHGEPRRSAWRAPWRRWRRRNRSGKLPWTGRRARRDTPPAPARVPMKTLRLRVDLRDTAGVLCVSNAFLLRGEQASTTHRSRGWALSSPGSCDFCLNLSIRPCGQQSGLFQGRRRETFLQSPSPLVCSASAGTCGLSGEPGSWLTGPTRGSGSTASTVAAAGSPESTPGEQMGPRVHLRQGRSLRTQDPVWCGEAGRTPCLRFSPTTHFTPLVACGTFGLK